MIPLFCCCHSFLCTYKCTPTHYYAPPVSSINFPYLTITPWRQDRWHRWLSSCHRRIYFHYHLGNSLPLSVLVSFPRGASGKEPACQCRRHESWVQSLGQKVPLEEDTATHSSMPAWRIPWTEEPGRLQSMGSQKVGHDWNDLAHMLYSSVGSLSWYTNLSIFSFIKLF